MIKYGHKAYKADCAFFIGEKSQKCSALENPCICFGCAFYKTKVERERTQRQAYRRLRKLSERKQDIIAEKYYDGRRPWER